ncbi:Uma2 family endonuclease [Ruegeria sp.]|uniref:Uma2 family endonuclease n=1 Tax=Ruegeria sp. TaxID=1879320 RepID=UPI003B00FBE3
MTAQDRNIQTPRRRATYQDVLDAPPNKVAEVLAGTLYTQPRPAMRHAWASSGVGAKINPPFNYGDGGPGGWWIIDEPELHLGEDILVPDLAGWRRETMPDYPDTAYCSVPPDWACEVLSPSTRRIDRHEKAGIYAREAVQHLWLVDPAAKTLEVLELRDGHWVLLVTLADDAPVSQPPFDAITFPLDALWPEGTSEPEGTGEERKKPRDK